MVQNRANPFKSGPNRNLHNFRPLMWFHWSHRLDQGHEAFKEIGYMNRLNPSHWQRTHQERSAVSDVRESEGLIGPGKEIRAGVQSKVSPNPVKFKRSNSEDARDSAQLYQIQVHAHS
jgi:hypothetical protein